MLSRFKIKTISVVMLSLLVSCGDHKSQPVEKKSTSNYLHGMCSDDVIDNVNEVIFLCNRDFREGERQMCQDEYDQFMKKYKGVGCLAENIETGEVVQVNEDLLLEYIN